MSYPMQSGAAGSWPTAAPGAIWAPPQAAAAADIDLRVGAGSVPWGRPPFDPIVRGVCNIDIRTGLASCRIEPPTPPHCP